MLVFAWQVTFVHKPSAIVLPFLYSVLLFGTGHELKLCDFGTATKIEHTLTNGVGTVRYMAPEVIKGIPHTINHITYICIYIYICVYIK